MNENDMIAYLPPPVAWTTYYHGELDGFFLYPSKVAVQSCHEILHEESGLQSLEMRSILNDLTALLYVALESDDRGFYMWEINKGSFAVILK